LGSTHGLLVYQEQIATAAHLLGDNISLDEGNQLRKVLTKKGTGKEKEVKDKLYNKFIKGCVEKGMSKYKAKEVWDEFELHSKYSFNRSHAISYSMISYQCAYLLHHFPAEWCAAFLDLETKKKDKKQDAISSVMAMGYEIAPIDINKSGIRWEVSEDKKSLVQPFTNIKGVGTTAIKQILENKPFNTVEDLFMNKNIMYRTLNKKVLNALTLCGALDSLIDDRFAGRKHFWSAMIVDRPKTLKKMNVNIDLYRDEGEFTQAEEVSFISSLTGVYPLDMIITDRLRAKFEQYACPPIANYDPELRISWGIPIEVIEKKTGSKKDYLIVKVIDETSNITTIKCWGIKLDKDFIHINRPYIIKPEYDPQWGYSTRGPVGKSWKLLA
jgi:DNA polymerase III alpha subunit